MSRKNGRSGKRGKGTFVAKPNGVLTPRVQKIGPERFGIVAVDVGKKASQWMVTDFYGRILVEPTMVTHDRISLRSTITKVRQAVAEHRLGDMVVSVERTGSYHRPVFRAFRDAGFETRIVHPFCTKQFRQPANPGDKTDANDLAAIVRATVNGFGLIEQTLEGDMSELRLLVRARRDGVRKTSRLRCQIRRQLDAAMPGYIDAFSNFFESERVRAIAREFGSAAAILKAGVNGMSARLEELGIGRRSPTIQKAFAWAQLAADPEPDGPIHHQLFIDLEDEWLLQRRKILKYEARTAGLLARTPYVLLLAIPGINVVSAGEAAGEMGPIEHYANPNAITGRAGLFPSRYQSNEVDRNGHIVRQGNRRLRHALMLIADNLLTVNNHYRGRGAVWKAEGRKAGVIHVRVAKSFSRLLFAIVSGRRIINHDCCREPEYILGKLLQFHHEHGTDAAQILADLEAATDQLPAGVRLREREPLAARLGQIDNGRTRGPKHIREVLVQVLARLGAEQVESNSSEERDPS